MLPAKASSASPQIASRRREVVQSLDALTAGRGAVPIGGATAIAVLTGLLVAESPQPVQALAIACATAVCLGLLLAFKASPLGRGLPLARYLALWTACIGLFFVTFNAMRVNPHVTLSDIMLFVAVGGFVVSLLLDRWRMPAIPGWLLISAVGLTIAGLMSTLSSQDFGTSMVATAEFVIALLGIPITIIVAADSWQRLLAITIIWVASATASSAIGTTDFTGLTAVGSALTGSSFAGRPSGLTVHPNHLGMASAMALPVAVFFAARAFPRVGAQLGYWAAVALLASGVLISGSRAALLGAMAGLVVFAFLRRRLVGAAVILAGIGALLLIMNSDIIAHGQLPSGSSAFLALERLTNDVSTGDSNALRLQYYSDALSQFANDPLTGIGFNVVRNAHDIYLQLLAAGGLIALSSFGIFVIGVLAVGISLATRASVDPKIRGLAAAVTGSVTVWLVAGVAQNLIYDRFLYVPAGLVLGLRCIAIAAATIKRSVSGVPL